jgi:quinol monooxygenase YgiN
VNQEPGTISLVCDPGGSSSFAIFDTFDDEAGRDAHLNGKVAAALMEKIKAGICFPRLLKFIRLQLLRTSFLNKPRR